MTFPMELSPEEAKRVEQAQAKGLDPDTLLRGLIASMPPLELFAQ